MRDKATEDKIQDSGKIRDRMGGKVRKASQADIVAAGKAETEAGIKLKISSVQAKSDLSRAIVMSQRRHLRTFWPPPLQIDSVVQGTQMLSDNVTLTGNARSTNCRTPWGINVSLQVNFLRM
ncbi:Opaque-specific ABC transporter CDR3 [Fusarium oxysporum f. sp. albedinis]|nr:putative oxidoreductase C19A8.06 [Fusarium oxysporum f. sp. albedinis]KAJ0135153.1 Opaque-specific ABC transporter CDR3 [Fusarium oxysporum f. sp. albedinis]